MEKATFGEIYSMTHLNMLINKPNWLCFNCNKNLNDVESKNCETCNGLRFEIKN